MLWGLPLRVRVSPLGVYLLFALSSLRERLSCSLRLPPLPLYGYPCGLLPLIPLLRFPLTLFLNATDNIAIHTIAGSARIKSTITEV